MDTQDITQAGAAIVLAAATALGDTFINDGRTFMFIDNADAAPVTVTIAPSKATRTIPGLGVVNIEDIVVAVPAGEQRMIAVPRGYNDDEGIVTATYSAVANVTVAAVRMPQL